MGDACMLRVVLAALALLFGSVAVRHTAHAHHSWKCPPKLNVTVSGVDSQKRLVLQIEATNTCGCRIQLRTCPSDDNSNAACRKEWLAPGATWRFDVKGGAADGKAKFDWGTHSNEAPC